MRSLYALLIAFLLVGTACEKEFSEINENPNAPEEADPRFLLPNVLWEAADNNAREGWTAGNLIAQHTANLEFLPADRFQLGTNEFYWEDLYRHLNDLRTIRKNAGNNAAYKAVSKIMRAYLASQLTDLWIDVPYSEALQGETEGNFTPEYDRQRDIYLSEADGILKLLKEGVSTLKNADDPLPGDIMFDGNLDRWVRFGNALRVRYLMRISKRVDVGPDLQTIVDNGNLMRSNADNAVIPYLSSAPNQWFIFNERVGRYTDVRMSATIDSVLDTLNDPRKKVLFKPAASAPDSAPFYKGIPNGLSRESQTAYDLSNISLLGRRFRDVPDAVVAPFMLYSEQQFALAEAVQKGWINGNASTYYREGIRAMFDHYGLAMPSGYLDQAAVALNGNNELRKILTQKWLSLFLNGHEAWFNIRRTGIPDLPIPPDNLNNDRFPVRYRYPESEQAVNGEHYSEASARIGGDDYVSTGWWEK